MNKKLLATVYLLLSSMIFMESPTLASPISGEKFVSNCADLQRYANTRRSTWKRASDTSFSGFEKEKLIYAERRFSGYPKDNYDEYECRFAYITSISPLGKKVCYGFLRMYYTAMGKKSLQWGYVGQEDSFPPPESKYCRYVN
jgi:hypothetical protein